ncbi:UNVERIFIED_CONTAM: hypothetical protein H355_013301 [Colinus virginianus]|nr:hypothetical protein H355_013301 [Colinus virginianus]
MFFVRFLFALVQMSGISSCLLGSAQSRDVKDSVKTGVYRVIYMTPEFCSGNLELLQDIDRTTGKLGLRLKCKEVWSLNGLVKYLFGKQLLKDKSIRCGNWEKFPLDEEQKLYAATDAYHVCVSITVSSSMYEFEGPTIIYCPSRKATEQVVLELNKLGVTCGAYHAGMGIQIRRDTHHQFMRDEIQVPIVALTATASPSIREDIVSCLNLKNPQITCTSFDRPNLYLEVGRQSGNILRDLKQFLIRKGRIILSHFEDKQLRKVSSGIMGTEECCDNCRCRTSCWAASSDSEGCLQDFGKQAYQLLSAVSALEEKFGTRVPILFLRGSNSQRVPDRYRKHALYGSGKDWTENWWKSLGQQLILEGFLREVSGRSKFATTCGLTQKGRNWLMRAESDSNPSLLLQSNEDLNLQRTPRSQCEGGILFHYSSRPSPAHSMQRSPDTKGAKQSPVKQMSLYEMFACEKKAGTLPRSSTMVNSDQTQRLTWYVTFISPPERSPVASPLRPRVPVVSSRENELETALYGKLLTARQKVANEKVIPPAVLATNKILVEMARVRPTTVENVKRIDGVSEAKSTMLVFLLAEIKDFCQANSLQTDIFPKPESTDRKEISPWKNTGVLSPSEHVTYVLFQEKNLSLRTISETRSLPLSEVGTHLFRAMKAGHPVNLERAGLTPEVQQIISEIIRNPPIDSDTTKFEAIRKLVPANIEQYLIQMTIALLEKKDGSKPQRGSGAKRMLVLSDGPQKTEADQTNRGKALWSGRKGNLASPTLKEGDVKSHPHVVPSALAAWSTDDAQPGNRGAADHTEPVQLASRNQLALSPDEELFAHTQPKVRLPEQSTEMVISVLSRNPASV